MGSSFGCARGEGGLSLPGDARRGASASPSEPARPDQTFPRVCRLTARRQFQAVYNEGRRVTSASFTLFGLPNEQGHCRLGLTVPRRIGGAVVRNRVKRRLREAFRRHRSDLRPALDLVVNARSGIDDRPYAQLEAEFLRTFVRLAKVFPP